MASNQQANIPRKHQVIIDEMMTGEAGDVGDMLMKKEGKQGFIFDDILKEEESKQGICSSHRMSEVAGDQGVIFIVPGVILGHTLKKHVRRRRVITQVHGIAKVSNRTLGDLQFVRGDEFAKRTIPQGGHVSFVTKNSRGHVIYDGTNVQGGPHNCAWLLAWCVHSDGYGNQVYVECGPRGIITAIPDYTIYEKLDACGSLSTYVNRETKTDASARIEAICTAPKLGCVFDVGGNRS